MQEYTPDSITGIFEIDNENILVEAIPNPFTNSITFSASYSKPTTIVLFDILSNQILEKIFLTSTTISTDKLPAGIYFYELRNEYRTIANGKVIKIWSANL